MDNVNENGKAVNGDGRWMSNKELSEIYGGLQFAMGQISAMRNEITAVENRTREINQTLDGLRRLARSIPKPQRHQVL